MNSPHFLRESREIVNGLLTLSLAVTVVFIELGGPGCVFDQISLQLSLDLSVNQMVVLILY